MQAQRPPRPGRTGVRRTWRPPGESPQAARPPQRLVGLGHPPPAPPSPLPPWPLPSLSSRPQPTFAQAVPHLWLPCPPTAAGGPPRPLAAPTLWVYRSKRSHLLSRRGQRKPPGGSPAPAWHTAPAPWEAQPPCPAAPRRLPGPAVLGPGSPPHPGPPLPGAGQCGSVRLRSRQPRNKVPRPCPGWRLVLGQETPGLSFLLRQRRSALGSRGCDLIETQRVCPAQGGTQC